MYSWFIRVGERQNVRSLPILNAIILLHGESNVRLISCYIRHKDCYTTPYSHRPRTSKKFIRKDMRIWTSNPYPIHNIQTRQWNLEFITRTSYQPLQNERLYYPLLKCYISFISFFQSCSFFKDLTMLAEEFHSS